MSKVTVYCPQCGIVDDYEEIIWDENGAGYSTKLVKCKHCGRLIIVKVIRDRGYDVNKDKRFYEY